MKSTRRSLFRRLVAAPVALLALWPGRQVKARTTLRVPEGFVSTTRTMPMDQFLTAAGRCADDGISWEYMTPDGQWRKLENP